MALFLYRGKDAGSLVLAKTREHRLRAHEVGCQHELIAEHEAIEVQVMSVDLPTPRRVRRWRAEDADPVEPFAIFLGLAGNFECVLVEPHDVSGGLVPGGTHGF